MRIIRKKYASLCLILLVSSRISAFVPESLQITCEEYVEILRYCYGKFSGSVRGACRRLIKRASLRNQDRNLAVNTTAALSSVLILYLIMKNKNHLISPAA